MKNKFILIFMVVIAMGMTACSSEPKGETISANTDSRQETDQEETADTETAETKTNNAEPSEPEITEEDETDCEEVEEIEEEDIPQGDPIAGIVDAYDGNTITVRTPEDDMRYLFSAENVPILEGYSTEDAHAVEGDFSIVAGDKVEVSYRGLLDDEKHPIEAVKIVVIKVE